MGESLPPKSVSLGPKIAWYDWFKPKVCSSCRVLYNLFEVTSDDLDEYEGANLQNCFALLVQVEQIANLQES